MGERRGIRVAVDWRRVGHPSRAEGDVGRYQRSLTAALAATAAPGDEVWALIAWPRAADLLPSGIGHAGVGRSGGDRGAMLETLGADVAILAHELPDDVRVPAAIVMHDVLPVTHPEWAESRDRGAGREQTVAMLHRAATVVATSEHARTDILSVVDLPDHRVVVVPPVVGPDFGPRSGAASRVAVRFGLGRYCVVLGDPAPRGNLAHLVAAVMRTGGGVTVVSPLAPPRRGRDADGILFAGPLTDPERADLLAGAAFVAAVPFADGVGQGVLEAMACGAPVLVSDRGALPEVTGGAAIVVPPTVNAIAEGIRAVEEPDTAARLRVAGPEQASRYGVAPAGRLAWGICDRLRADPVTAGT